MESETGWVIEKGSSPMGLGVECGRLKWVGFGSAIRFSRKVDAEAFMGLLDDDEGAKAVEHGWADIPRETDLQETGGPRGEVDISTRDLPALGAVGVAARVIRDSVVASIPGLGLTPLTALEVAKQFRRSGKGKVRVDVDAVIALLRAVEDEENAATCWKCGGPQSGRSCPSCGRPPPPGAVADLLRPHLRAAFGEGDEEFTEGLRRGRGVPSVSPSSTLREVAEEIRGAGATRPCPSCGGTGIPFDSMVEPPCAECGGSGRVTVTNWPVGFEGGGEDMPRTGFPPGEDLPGFNCAGEVIGVDNGVHVGSETPEVAPEVRASVEAWSGGSDSMKAVSSEADIEYPGRQRGGDPRDDDTKIIEKGEE